MGRMHRFINAGIFLGVVFAVGTFVNDASAQDGNAKGAEQDAQKKAREYYGKGKSAYDKGQYPEALEAFETAYEAKPHPAVLKSIAECHVQLGNVPAAIATLEKYLADPESSGKKEVEGRLAEIKSLLGTTTFNSTPPGAQIAIDGRLIGETTPATVEVLTGKHEVTFTLDEYEPLVQSVDIQSKAENIVSADFEAQGTRISAHATETDPADESLESSDLYGASADLEADEEGPPTLFWVAAAVAGAGLVSGTVFGTMALNDEDYWQEKHKPETKDAGQRNAIIADVSFGVALAAGITGAIVLILDKKEDSRTEEQARAPKIDVYPLAGSDAVGLGTTVHF